MFFRLSKTTWALLFACFSMFVLGVGDNIRGPLFPELLNYFKLTNSQASLSFAFSSGAAFTGNTVAAWWLKKIQLDRLMAISMLVMMAGLLCMGLAPTFYVYILSSVVFGFSLGTTGVAQNLLIAENVEGPRQRKALAGLHGIYGLSSLVAPFLASRLPGWFQTHGAPFVQLAQWQSAFFFASALAMSVLILVLATDVQPKFSHHHPAVSGGDSKRTNTLMFWFAGFFATYVGAEILVSTRLALYMRTYFSMSLEESSNYVTLFFLFLLIGRLLFAVKTFKASLRTQMNLSLGLSLLFLVLGLWVHPFCMTLVGLTMAPFYPLAIVYISERTGIYKRRFLTFAMGIQGICVISMHLGVGYLTDVFGLYYAFGVGIIFLAGALFCLNFHPHAEA